MTEEPETNVMDQMQDIAENLVGDNNETEEEEEKNDNLNEEKKNEEEEDHPHEEEEPKGELDALLANVTNNLAKEEEEEKTEPVPVSEPKTTSEKGSRRHKRNSNSNNYSLDQEIEVVIPDLPFAPQPKDPNITHFIFEYDDEGVKRNTTRNRQNSSRSKYNSTVHRGAPPENGGSLYDNSPYFSKPFVIYKVPKLARTSRPNHALTSRSKSTDRNMSSTQRSNYSNSGSSAFENSRSSYVPVSRRYSTKPPPPSNYVERTREFEERQRRYNAEFAERYKLTHPLSLYQKHHQKTVLEMKIEKQRIEEMRYKKAAEAAKKKRIKNQKNHEEFIKKTEIFENEGEQKPKYLENVEKRRTYLDFDDGSFVDEKQNQEEEEEKGELEDHVADTANALLGTPKNDEEEERKDEEEEEKKDEEKGDIEGHIDDTANGLLGSQKKEEEEEKGELEEHVDDTANALLS